MIYPQPRPTTPAPDGGLLYPGDICLDDAQPLWQVDQTCVLLHQTLLALHRDHTGGLLTLGWQRWYRALHEEGRRWTW